MNRWLLVVLISTGCVGVVEGDDAGESRLDGGTPADAGDPDAGVRDSGTPDAGGMDAGLFDAGTPDAGAPDAGLLDAGVVDAGTPDAGVIDAGPNDAGARDAGVSRDAGTYDAGPTWDGGLPYSLPAIGTAVTIGTNHAVDVRPSGFSSTQFGYSAFDCYGSGVFVPSVSGAGAYVIASSGGHLCPELIDALVFDFTDATWKLIPSSNGIPSSPTPFQLSQITGPYGELTGATSGQVPAPSHLYQSAAWVPPRLGGGPLGTYLKLLTRFAGPTPSSYMGAHRLDLSTGLWTRATDDRFSTDIYEFYNSHVAVFADIPGSERYYLLSGDFHKENSLHYWDPSDGHIKNTVGYPWPSAYTCYPGCGNPTFVFDPVRKLIISQGGRNSGNSGWPLQAIDLNDISAGWKELVASGTQPGALHDAPRWSYFPPTGNFYTHDYDDGAQLWRMSPPSGDWKTGTWTFDRVSVTGAALPPYTDVANGPHDSSRGTFLYVPALEVLAWISGEDASVVILRPPQ